MKVYMPFIENVNVSYLFSEKTEIHVFLGTYYTEKRGFWSFTEVLLDMVASGSELGWLKWPDENGVSNAEEEILDMVNRG